MPPPPWCRSGPPPPPPGRWRPRIRFMFILLPSHFPVGCSGGWHSDARLASCSPWGRSPHPSSDPSTLMPARTPASCRRPSNTGGYRFDQGPEACLRAAPAERKPSPMVACCQTVFHRTSFGEAAAHVPCQPDPHGWMWIARGRLPRWRPPASGPCLIQARPGPAQ
jgi:hypothetical protein